MSNFLRCIAVAVVIVLLYSTPVVRQGVNAKPAPSPSPSPTNPPTPYMPVEQVTNGTWQIIMQPRYELPSYSTMKLLDIAGKVSGTWLYDKKTNYTISGTRDGSHLKLDIKRADKPDVAVGSIDAMIDGIADMYGTITLNSKDTPFQGAQHSRVPPPVEATPGPNATVTPY